MAASTDLDIIIIGAGIAGTSAAAFLASNQKVLVLEQESHPGYHSTGRSAATWAPFYGPTVIQSLTALSGPTLHNPDPSLGGQAFTSPRGQMVISVGGDDEALQECAALGMQPLSLADAQALVPLLNTNVVKKTLYTDKLVNIDVNALHQAFIKRATNATGEIICDAKVTNLAFQDQHWHVQTGKGRYRAPIIINAAGAWADKIAELAGLKPLGLTPKRRSAALLPFSDYGNMPNWPLIFDARENFYCIPFGNAMLVSPADQTPVQPHDAWPEDIDIARGIECFQQTFDYEVVNVTHSWAGLRTFAPDGVPVAGYDPRAQGFFWLAGQGGYGIQTSPALATLTCGLIEKNIGSYDPEYQKIAQQLAPQRLC